jgi:hypothetical protein
MVQRQPGGVVVTGALEPRQDAPSQSKKPPSAWALRLDSSTAWYSGVSGAPCPLPQDLLGSNDGCPARPDTRWRSHWPFQSGYFPSCAAAARPKATVNAATTGAVLCAQVPMLLG